MSATRSLTTPRTPGAPWRVADAATFLDVSVRHLRRLLATNQVKSIRLGRRRLIPDAEVQRLARAGC